MAKVWDQHHQLQEAKTTEDALKVLLGAKQRRLRVYLQGV